METKVFSIKFPWRDEDVFVRVNSDASLSWVNVLATCNAFNYKVVECAHPIEKCLSVAEVVEDIIVNDNDEEIEPRY